jgi:NADH-quinone oxidoreductase subunit J
MTTDLIVFFVLALAAVGAALGMVFIRNAVYSALFLVLNFNVVAVFYLLLGAPFIAMTQITVYAGAIMVLFLFVIMLLGAVSLPRARSLPWQKPLAYVFTAVLAFESIWLVVLAARPQMVIRQPGIEVNSMDHLRGMAMTLFEDYLLPFEAISVLLLAAMVGAIVLTRHEKEMEEQG